MPTESGIDFLWLLIISYLSSKEKLHVKLCKLEVFKRYHTEIMKKHSIHSILTIKQTYLPNPPADGLVTGRVLGRGSFCVVKEVIRTHTSGSGSDYALKQLRTDLSPEDREHAQASLVNEIKILQNVLHPNIVKIR